MTKKLLFTFLCLMTIIFYQSKNIVIETPKSEIFCDNLPPANVQVSNITMTSAVITWTADPTVANYVLRFRVPSGAWSTVASVPQNTFTLTGLQPCQAYEVQVAKMCPGSIVQGAWSNILGFSTYHNYCAAGSTDSGIVHISNVKVTPSGTNISQMISNSTASNYTDYRNDTARRVYLAPNSSLNAVSVTNEWTATQTTSAVSVWIDFNGNGDFEPTEKILSTNLSPAASGAAQTFSVPASAAGICGVTMRVITSNVLTTSACGVFSGGEAEDYLVIFTEPVLAVNEIEENKEGSIYPNPTSDFLIISGISGNEFEIYNAVGQKVRNGKISDQKVNVRDLAKGIYFIQIKSKNKIKRLKFIKE